MAPDKLTDDEINEDFIFKSIPKIIRIYQKAVDGTVSIAYK